MRNLIARMKIIPIDSLIRNKRLLLIDDSIVRGTQLRETTEFLYQCGAREVHIRPACPPLVYGCPYLNFSRATSVMDLITRRVIRDMEGDKAEEKLPLYTDPETPEYRAMLDGIRNRLNFTSLEFNRLDDMIDAIGLPACKLCTYCFNGKG
jgi:amidophosphoribosyltransferase